MSNNTTLVVTATPNPDEMQALQSYLQAVLPLFIKAGGILVKRLNVSEVIMGSPSGMVMVMDFDNAESIKDLFDSEDYAKLLPMRDLGFTDMNIMVTTSM